MLFSEPDLFSSQTNQIIILLHIKNRYLFLNLYQNFQLKASWLDYLYIASSRSSLLSIKCGYRKIRCIYKQKELAVDPNMQLFVRTSCAPKGAFFRHSPLYLLLVVAI
jgi:hypothetical protein